MSVLADLERAISIGVGTAALLTVSNAAKDLPSVVALIC